METPRTIATNFINGAQLSQNLNEGIDSHSSVVQEQLTRVYTDAQSLLSQVQNEKDLSK
ncbi:hypothetical protein CV093_09660 [Oceanobacillus sp. 143]|nr:hypothetical protein CV093_09660 [Oceanobacillus sp. 143]